MDTVTFTLNGTRHTLTRDQVTRAMRQQTPGTIHTYSVEIEGIAFPVKQVLAQSLRIPVTDFISTRAQDILGKLGFVVESREDGPPAIHGMPVPIRDIRDRSLALATRVYAGTGAAPAVVLGSARSFSEWLAGGE
jgi:hypothetical protein